jgi:thiol-disulfide isomerase/thioredoxin
MKQISVIILGILFSIQSIAQKGPISIQAKITNNTATKVEFESESGEKFELPIDKKNEVKGVITAARGEYQMKIGEEYTPVFLKPNSNLNFTIDLKEFDETISYSGSLAFENNALAKSMLADENFNENAKSNFGLNESEYSKKINDYTELKSTFFSKKMDEEFKDDALNKLKYKRFEMLLQYPSYHAYFTKNDSFKVSDKYYDFMSEIDFSNAENFKGENIYIVSEFIEVKLKNSKVDKKDELAYEIEKIKLINSIIENKELKNQYVSVNYKSQFIYSPNPKRISEELLKLVSSDKLKNEVTSYLNQLETLSEGKAAPEFKLLCADGKIKSLTDYRGKYVYIDVWATWCGPCKKELPSYETLKADYKGKNVEFVSVCVWDEKSKWEKFLTEKKLNGEQLFIEGQKSSFVENYMIQGVPTFILIDTQGNIISRNAERPSDKAIRMRLDKLMN